jgi:hypothetical protein
MSTTRTYPSTDEMLADAAQFTESWDWLWAPAGHGLVLGYTAVARHRECIDATGTTMVTPCSLMVVHDGGEYGSRLASRELARGESLQVLTATARDLVSEALR